MSSDVNIRDIGPIANLGIHFKPGGGVTELLGANGTGKTTATNAVNALATGKGSLPKRDGAFSGEVESQTWHARIGVRARSQHTGDAEVVTLEGRLNLHDLIDPGLKNDIAADTRRIKALLSIAKAQPDPSIFYDLIGGQEAFEEIVDADARKSSDLIALAAKVQQALHEKARREESRAEHEDGHAVAKREMAAQFDADLELDSGQAHADLEAAIAENGKLQERYDASEKAKADAEEAQRKIDVRRSGQKYLSPEQAKTETAKVGEELDALRANQRNLADRIAALEEEHAAATRLVDACQARYDSALERQENAVQQEATLGEWEETVRKSEEAVKQAPTEEELVKSVERVGECRAAVNRAAAAGRARDHLTEAGKHENTAKEHRMKAAQFRQAAAAVDDILSEQVAKVTPELRVIEQRLVTSTGRSDNTLFAELSPGERTRIALACAVQAVGPGGLIPLAQEDWAHLDPDGQEMVDRWAREQKIHVLAARATRGPLRCVPFGAEDPFTSAADETSSEDTAA